MKNNNKKPINNIRFVSGRIFNISGRKTSPLWLLILIPILAIAIGFSVFWLTGCNDSAVYLYTIENSDGKRLKDLDGIEHYTYFAGCDFSLRNKKVGLVDNEKTDVLFSAKGYETSEWIIRYHDVEMGWCELYKRDDVETIPPQFEELLVAQIDPQEVIKEEILAKDGHKIISNSGMGWNFTVRKDVPIEGYDKTLKEVIKEHTQIDITQYFKKGIDVSIYSACPLENWSEYAVLSSANIGIVNYLFVFTGDELIYTSVITNDEMEIVKKACIDLAEGNGLKWIN